MNWNVLDLSSANFRLLTSDWPLDREINGQRMAFTLPISPTVSFAVTPHPDIFRELRRTCFDLSVLIRKRTFPDTTHGSVIAKGNRIGYACEWHNSPPHAYQLRAAA